MCYMRNSITIFTKLISYVHYRVNTVGGSATGMEEYTRAHASRVPDVGTGGASGKTRNLRCETSATHACAEQI